MRSLRKPNGSERDRLFATDLLDMEIGKRYAYHCKARTLRHAQEQVGATDRIKLDGDARIIVHRRFSDTEWGWMPV